MDSKGFIYFDDVETRTEVSKKIGNYLISEEDFRLEESRSSNRPCCGNEIAVYKNQDRAEVKIREVNDQGSIRLAVYTIAQDSPSLLRRIKDKAEEFIRAE